MVWQLKQKTCIQQGDPLVLSALAVDDAVRSVKSKFNIWLPSDAVISDYVGTVIIDIISLTNSLYEIGLVDNQFKSGISSINYRKHHLPKVKQDVQTSLYDVKERKTADSTILDFPIDFAIVRRHLDESCSHLELMAQWLNTIQP